MRRIVACLVCMCVLGLSVPVTAKKSDRTTIRPAAAAFTAGNIVVCRVGTGSGALGTGAAAVFLDEYTSDGAFVASTPLPTANSAPNFAFTVAGSATTECQMTRSTDGRYLVLVGYPQAPGTPSVAGTSAGRVFARVDSNGNINTSTATDTFGTSAVRGAAATDGSGFWATGTSAGVAYKTFGTVGPSTVVSETITLLRGVNIFGGQLYTSSNSGSYRLGAVGTGTPTSTSNTSTNLPGFPTANSPHAFFFADLEPTVGGVDTLYVADDGAAGATATSGGVKKFSLVSGIWTFNGNFPANASPVIGASSFIGVTGQVSGTQVTLFATRTANGGQLVRFVDNTGYNVAPTAVPTLLVTAAANTAFRGVALAPVLPAASPSTTTSAASNLAGTSVTLNGTANPNGAATTGYFRYSTADPGTCNDAFGTRAPASGGASLGSGMSAVGFSENVTGLTAGTTYYFCAIAQNSVGTTFGTVQSFATAAGLSNLSINDVTQTEGNAGTTAYTFTVTLSAPAGPGGVTFDISTADGSAQDGDPSGEDNDYTPSSLTGQTIAAGATTYQFTVTVNGDAIYESNESYFVNVTNVAGATVTDGQGQGTLTNDDLAPTAGPVSITGRILTRQGVGVSNAMVSLMDQHGVMLFARTNSLGYYRFDSVPAGASYILSVAANPLRFAPQLLNANLDVSELNIYPER